MLSLEDVQAMQESACLLRSPRITRSPSEGMGKPEPLKHALAGYGSRRINDEHRIVYKSTGGEVLIAQLRYPY